MPAGYNGKVLRVNLTAGSLAVETPAEEFYRTYFGGGAFASAYLLRELPAGVDPLGPDNVLVFATSVLVGAPAAGLSRFTVAAKSPLTGGYGESEAGGFFGPELKFAGFDAVIITGRAPKPVYLWLCDGQAEIRDASHLWGKTTGDVEQAIREELNDNLVRVAQIGPAGEKLVRFANIVNNLKHCNGRTGMGAVMGSKNLRAIAARGHQKMAMADPEAMRALARRFTSEPNPLSEYGTPLFVNALNKGGILPTRNFAESVFEGASEISGERMKETILQGREGCYACAVRCKRVVKAEGEVEINPAYGGPEYEALGAFGSLCGVSDLVRVCKANEICNSYGCDVISTGASVAFAMECFQRGILTTEDTGGLDLRFGNAEAMLAMVGRIARREGLGNTLAEGTRRAAERIGRGADRFALHVKGQELPMHEGRGKVALGLGYAVSPTGADHLEAPHDSSYKAPGPFLDKMKPLGLLNPLPATDLGPEKVRYFVYLQNVWGLYNTLGICNFTGAPGYEWTFDEIVRLTEAMTGWKTSLFELIKINERATTMARLFNVREGFGRAQDTLPARLFEPLPSGPLEGVALSHEVFEDALSTYYAMMGWDAKTGVPTDAKLHELNLGWAI